MFEWLRDPIWQGIGVVVPWLISLYKAIESKNKIWSYIAATLTILSLGLFLGFNGAQLTRIESFNVELAGASDLFSETNSITVTSFEFNDQNKLFVRGKYKNLLDSPEIWIYVQANDGKFYFAESRKSEEKTWASFPIPIGDGRTLGRAYTIGLLMGDSRSCADLKNQSGLINVPSCAKSRAGSTAN